MVGATGIEPVTPTMSIVVDANAKVEMIQNMFMKSMAKLFMLHLA